jgi:hypothetical protein
MPVAFSRNTNRVIEETSRGHPINLERPAGAVLGRFFKVLVLVPACAFLLVAVVVRSAEHGLLSPLLEFAVLSATLQIGYVSGLVSHLIPSVSERRGTTAAPRAAAARPTVLAAITGSGLLED